MDGLSPIQADRLTRKRKKAQGEELLLLPRFCFRFSVGEDDVRIAGAPVKRADPGESSAADFYNQHNMGNIQTALQLGGCLARLYCGYIRKCQEPEPVLGQLAILFSYAVNRSIQCLPNSLIAQTVLSTFYNTVQQESAELYQKVRDPVPFSLYILRDKRAEPAESYGDIFSSLCAGRVDSQLADMANWEYEEFYRQCLQLAEGFTFQA